ncbi:MULTISPECIES: sugar ABC transporter permease [Halocynthiibacter]|uniref:Xylose transport system permease protein XylH n=1 Tax=Halocynthiibacter halioticoli TaxID=2986804 RepID=A0AAE3LQG5_9RHOB|nr:MULTISPECIES: sugar ABC transporter permease [Halocynthiibacter]MCV6823499.1 sugar ABC transporter permease [Halocynthiibacter halioticoli]MCW4056500.1 sugar ABC transporter permease [Halocynthiibacter sp. SDUM655004]
MTTETLEPPSLAEPTNKRGFNVRTLSLVGLLVVIAVTFHFLSGGLFLSARNLYNLVVQTSVVAILACGMTLVIVTRNIDLSVGSVLGCVGMVIALLQIEIFPQDAAWNWPLTVAIGIGLGALIGAWHGVWIAYFGVPSFVVTLGGLLIFRGAAFEVAQGKTLAPFDPVYRLFGGGIDGALGVGPSWALFAIIMVLYGLGEVLVHRRQMRLGFDSTVRTKLLRFLAVFVVAAAFVATMNSYMKPRSDIGRGIPVPALVLLSVVLFMEFVTRFTTFGRYIFAIGGNIEAARLNGIPTRRTVLKVFIAMGVLCAIAAVVTTARLNAGTSSTGELLELSAIAAAVIGGASLSGGRGTIAGAVVGALIIQSLESGMVLIGASSSQRMVAIGLVLMVAVLADKYLSGEE